MRRRRGGKIDRQPTPGGFPEQAPLAIFQEWKESQAGACSYTGQTKQNE